MTLQIWQKSSAQDLEQVKIEEDLLLPINKEETDLNEHDGS